MPNKYYLRSDRTAVNPTVKEPSTHPWADFTGDRVSADKNKDDWDYWERHLRDLPALTVDPAYLETLSIGWFEAKERYERLNEAGRWVEVTDDAYTLMKPLGAILRLTIIAPQEAEKCICEDDNKLTQALCKVHNPRPAEKGQGQGQEGEVMNDLDGVAKEVKTYILMRPPDDDFKKGWNGAIQKVLSIIKNYKDDK